MFVYGGVVIFLLFFDVVVKRGKEVGLKNVELIYIYMEGLGELVKFEYDGE